MAKAKKQNIRYFYYGNLVFLLICSLTSCASLPDFCTSLPRDNDYYYGCGKGKDPEEARDVALKNLQKQADTTDIHGWEQDDAAPGYALVRIEKKLVDQNLQAAKKWVLVEQQAISKLTLRFNDELKRMVPGHGRYFWINCNHHTYAPYNKHETEQFDADAVDAALEIFRKAGWRAGKEKRVAIEGAVCDKIILVNPSPPPSAQATPEIFLAKVASAPGAQTFPSGLIYIPLSVGTGASPVASDTVTTNYTGTLPNGTIFGSSSSHGGPLDFPLNKVIPCWSEGVQKMKVGGKARLICPAGIAFGEQGQPPIIPGGATLIFTIELVGIKHTSDSAVNDIDSNNNAISSLRLGMTKTQITAILGTNNVRAGGAPFSDTCSIAGTNFLIFDGDVLTKVVPLGSNDGYGGTVSSCVSAQTSGESIVR